MHYLYIIFYERERILTFVIILLQLFIFGWQYSVLDRLGCQSAQN